jgi:hypothetical protein
MQIKGTEGLNADQLRSELSRGGKFVVFTYVISILVITFRRSSDIHFIRVGDNAVAKGMPYTLISFFFGWWGFPWGIIYTPMALATNFGGGKDVTAEVSGSLLPR